VKRRRFGPLQDVVPIIGERGELARIDEAQFPTL